MTRFGELLRLLGEAKVEFIVVGGVAAAAHGSGRATQDLDVVYRRTAAGHGSQATTCHTGGGTPGRALRCFVTGVNPAN